MAAAVTAPAAPPRPAARWAARGTLGVAAAAYLTLVDPSKGGAYPVCPFHAATGLWCPGCGGTRALHHLLRGDLAGALSSNVLVVAALPVVAWMLLERLTAGRARRVPPLPRLGTRGSVLVVGAVLAFAVLRNLSGTPFAALAP